MNVAVEMTLSVPPTEENKAQMYAAAEFLTNDEESIVILQPSGKPPRLVAEFSIRKARQIDVVDRIGKEFSYHVDDYNDSSISFPNKKSSPAKGCFTKATKPSVKTYTALQGQYLAFIYYYTKLNRMAPAEADMQRYFRKTPPTVHNMIVKLEELGFIERTPGSVWEFLDFLSERKIPLYYDIAEYEEDLRTIEELLV